MAEKSGSDESPVELRQKIARSRELVVRDLSGLRYELNFPLKFRRAFERHTAVWVGAALAVGLAIALLRARTQKVYVKPSGSAKAHAANKNLISSGLVLGAAKLAFSVLRPMVVNYLAKQGMRNMAGRFRRPR